MTVKAYVHKSDLFAQFNPETSNDVEVLPAVPGVQWVPVDGGLSMVYEMSREEGRREVLAEIAKFDPLCNPAHDEDNGQCFFCLLADRHGHAPSCLWRRAMDAVKG